MLAKGGLKLLREKRSSPEVTDAVAALLEEGSSVTDTVSAVKQAGKSLILTCEVTNMCGWAMKHVSSNTKSSMELPAQTIRPGFTEAFVTARKKATAKSHKGIVHWKLITGDQTSIKVSVEWFIPHKPDVIKVKNILRICIDDLCDKHEYGEEHERNCVCSSGVCVEALMGTSDQTTAYVDIVPIDFNQFVGSLNSYFSEYNHNISVQCENLPDTEEITIKQKSYVVYSLISLAIIFVIVLTCVLFKNFCPDVDIKPDFGD